MTSNEFVTELLGDGWNEEILPHLLDHVKASMKNSHRYAFLRDYANTISFNENPRNRVEMAEFDRMIDIKNVV